jgi:hypothetical protein
VIGVLAAEYDAGRRREVGNFPRALRRLNLILAARAISNAEADSTRVST